MQHPTEIKLSGKPAPLRSGFVKIRTIALGAMFMVLATGPMLLAAKPHDTQDKDRLNSSSQARKVLGIPLVMLEKSDLNIRWVFADLPLAGASRIAQIFYHHGLLFVLNDRNKLYAIQGKNGTIKWTVDLTKHRMPPAPIGFYKESLLFVFGPTFLQIRMSDGTIQEKFDFDVELATSADRSEERILFGCVDNQFYSVRASDQVPVWKSACADKPFGRVTVDRGQVFFVTRDHTLYVSTVEERRLLWKAPTVGALVGVVVNGEQCFLPSEDTALYCFEPKGGQLLWKYLAGGSLVELPIVTDQFVFQPVKHKSLLCLNRRDGSLQWELQEGKSFLAMNGHTTYALTLDNHLTLIDNVSGQRILSFFAEGIDLYASNREDNLIFIASKTGDLLALQPRHREHEMINP